MTRPRPTRRALPLATAIAVALTAGLLALTALPAGARTARPGRLPSATDPVTVTTDRTLIATGTARVRGVPDLLTVTLGVTSRGDTVGAALDHNNEAVAKVMKALDEGGVDKKDVQTSSFSIGPVYDDRSSAITGYQVSNVVSVQLRDLDHAGSIIDKAAAAGGNDAVVQGVSFGFDDTSALVAQARSEAVKRARAQAEQLADAAGVELVEVRTISESSLDAGPVLAAPEAAAKQADSIAISPGSEELSVQVSMVFTIR
jgi:uncharacterized protein YggE